MKTYSTILEYLKVANEDEADNDFDDQLDTQIPVDYQVMFYEKMQEEDSEVEEDEQDDVALIVDVFILLRNRIITQYIFFITQPFYYAILFSIIYISIKLFIFLNLIFYH